MADQGLNFEGLPEWQPDLLKGWKPLNLDKLAAQYEAQAAIHLSAAAWWSAFVAVYLIGSVFFGGLLYSVGIPFTVMFVRYCHKARYYSERAKLTRIRCDNDGLC